MKIKILISILCMLLISTVLPVAGTINQNNLIDNQFENRNSYLRTESEEDWWSMFRHDSGNTGSSSCEAPDTNELCWQKTISDSVGIAAPIVAGEKLYLSTGGYYNVNIPEQLNFKLKSFSEKPKPLSTLTKINSVIKNQYYGSLYCFNAVSGVPLWELYVGWSQDPAVVDDKLYLTMLDYYSYSSIVQCRDAESGQNVHWERTVYGWVFSSVIVADDKVYIGALDFYGYSGKLYCLDAQNGDILWTHTMPVYEFIYLSSPAVADGMVYFITLDMYQDESHLYCLNAETGQFQWHQPIGYSEYCSPVVADGQVYVVSSYLYGYYGDLFCFDAFTGSPKWTFNMGLYQVTLSNPAVYEDSVYLAVIDLTISSGRIYRLDVDTGDVIWDVQISGLPYYSSPAVADDKLYIPVIDFYSYLGKIICLDISNGDFIWDYFLSFFSMSSPAISNGRVFVPDYVGNIYSIGFPNDPPTPPLINGEKNGKAGKSYDYTFVSTDPEEEEVYYFVYWGDDSCTGWIGPYDSGEIVTVSHTWDKKDKYNNFLARAKDIHGSKSDWATYEVTMPASYQSFRSFILNLIENLIHNFPILEKICNNYILIYNYFFNQEGKQ